MPSQKNRLYKNVVNGNVFAVLPTCFGKSLIFQLFLRVISLRNGQSGTIFMIMVVCLALPTIMKDQVEHLKKIRIAVMAIGIDEKATKNRKVRDCV